MEVQMAKQILLQADFNGLYVTVTEKKHLPRNHLRVSEHVNVNHWLIEIVTPKMHEYLPPGYWRVPVFRRKNTCARDSFTQHRLGPFYLVEPYEVLLQIIHVRKLDVKDPYDAIVLHCKDLIDGFERQIPFYLPHGQIPHSI